MNTNGYQSQSLNPNSPAGKIITTGRGDIYTPCFIPVTTFGPAYPLDGLLRPYLPRFAQAIMVAAFYARQMPADYRSRIPVCVDSGGFASLFENSRIGWSETDGFGYIEVAGDDGVERTTAADVLLLQEKVADIGYTLDAIVTPETPLAEARRRIDFTIRNAQWAKAHSHNSGLKLFASLQCVDAFSAGESTREYVRLGFEGIAIGGMVPRLKDLPSVLEIVETVRSFAGDDMPIHVFGVGKPEIMAQVISAGADMCDSSSYVKAAAEGKSWLYPEHHIDGLSVTERALVALENLSAACGQPAPVTFPAPR